MSIAMAIPALPTASLPTSLRRMDVATDLAAWKEHRDESAFQRLVARHARLVSAACQRQLGPGQDADDAAQAVFIILATRPGAVGDPARLGSWLYAVAVRVCRNARRAAASRSRHERQAAPPPAPEPEEPAWEELRPLLDAALSSLAVRQREAVIAHYLEGRAHTDVAASLGISEDAARMRCAYALDSLRAWFRRRGIAIGAAALAAGLAGEAGAAEAAQTTSLAQAALHPVAGSEAMRLAATGLAGKWLIVAAATLAFMAAFAAWTLLPPTDPRAAEPPPPPPVQAGTSLERILALRLDAHYRRDRVDEVLADLRERTGLDAAFPPALATGTTFTLEGAVSVGQVLEALTRDCGLVMERYGDRVVFWKPVGDRILADLEQKLKTGAPAERLTAIYDLGRLGDPRACQPLLRTVAGADAEAAAWALRALVGWPVSCQDRAAVPAEAVLAHLAEPGMAADAVALLGESDDPRATGRLLALLSGADRTLAGKAREALRRSRDPGATAPLLALLGNADPSLLHFALLALAARGETAAVDPLLAQLGGKDRSEVIATLGSIRDPRVVEPLAARLDDPVVGFDAAVALARQGDPRGEAALIARLGDADPTRRAAAAEALGRLGGRQAVEPLLARLGDHDGQVKMTAAAALAQLRDPRVLEPLLAGLRGDGDGEETSWGLPAGEAIGRLRDPRTLDALMPLLEDPAMLRWMGAIEALARLRDPRTAELLRTRLRLAAVGSAPAILLAMGYCDDDATWKVLIDHLYEPDPEARSHAASALANRRDPRAMDALLEMLHDDPEVRSAALTAIGCLAHPRGVPALIALLDDADLHQAAATTLKRDFPSTSAIAAALSEHDRKHPQEEVLLELPGY